MLACERGASGVADSSLDYLAHSRRKSFQREWLGHHPHDGFEVAIADDEEYTRLSRNW